MANGRGIPSFEQLEQRELLSVASDDFSYFGQVFETGWSDNSWTVGHASGTADVIKLNTASTPTTERPSLHFEGRSGTNSDTEYDTYIERSVDLSNVTDPSLTFDYRTLGLESGDKFGVAFWTEPTGWVTQLSRDDGDFQINKTVFITTDEYDIGAAYQRSDFKIRFYINSFDSYQDDLLIDNIEIHGTGTTSEPSVGTGTYLASDDFELNSANEYGWKWNSWDAEYGVGDNVDISSGALKIKYNGYIERAADLSGVSGAKLLLNYESAALEDDDTFYVEMYDATNGWEVVASWNNGNQGDPMYVTTGEHLLDMVIPTSKLTEDFKLRLHADNFDNTYEWVTFDDVQIQRWVTDAPGMPDLIDDTGDSTDDNLTMETTDVAFTVNTTDGYTVRLYSVGAGGATTLLDTQVASGTTTVTLEADLADGVHTIAATQEDTNGSKGESPLGTALVVTVDSAAPAAPAAVDMIDASDTGSSVADNLTNDDTPTITGTAEANATVELFSGTTFIGETTADGSGDWSITASTLADGVHSITAKATDAAGNVSAASTALSVTVDTAAPATPSTPDLISDTGTSGTDDITSDNTPTISGTAEAYATVDVFSGITPIGQVTADASGNWSITSTTLADGTHSITAQATDAAGNVSAISSALSIVVDANNAAPVITAPTSVSVNEDTTLALTGSNTISLADDNDYNGYYSVTLVPSNGTVAVTNQPAGLTISGDSSELEIYGNSLTDINTALASVEFTPDANFSGSTSLYVHVGDLGVWSPNTNAFADTTISITVNEINDAPVWVTPSSVSVDEDTTLTFTGANAISLSDVDDSPYSITLVPTNGTVAVPNPPTGATISGTATELYIEADSLAAANGALANIEFTPTANFSGSASLFVHVGDHGENPPATVAFAQTTVSITVNQVEDAAVLTAPSSTVSASKNTTLSFIGGNAISVADVDADYYDGNYTVTLVPTNGIVAVVNPPAGVTITGSSTELYIEASSLADLNAALANVAFTPTTDYTGPASLEVHLADHGLNAPATVTFDNATISITVS